MTGIQITPKEVWIHAGTPTGLYSSTVIQEGDESAVLATQLNRDWSYTAASNN